MRVIAIATGAVERQGRVDKGTRQRAVPTRMHANQKLVGTVPSAPLPTLRLS